jgi:hypothetical protein
MVSGEETPSDSGGCAGRKTYPLGNRPKKANLSVPGSGEYGEGSGLGIVSLVKRRAEEVVAVEVAVKRHPNPGHRCVLRAVLKTEHPQEEKPKSRDDLCRGEKGIS